MVERRADMVAPAPPTARWSVVGYLTGAHLLHDMYLGVLGILLPFLREDLGFSLVLAGLLMPAQQTGSLAQPLLGHLADRFGRRRFVIVFLTATSVAMSLMGLSLNYVMLIIVVAIGGLSSAAYHPAGSALVTEYAGTRWGTALALYHFGGNLGLALGPLAAAFVVSSYGLRFTWMLAVPGVLWALSLLLTVPSTAASGRGSSTGRAFTGWVLKHKRVFGSLAVVVFGRALGAGGLALFLPSLLLERDYSLALVAVITSGFFIVGGAGGLLAGWLSDRVGRRFVIGLMLVVGPTTLVGFLLLNGVAAVAFLLIASLSMRGEQPVVMAMIQEWAPDRRGAVVGLVLGTQFVLAGVGTLFVGWLASHVGLNNAFLVIAWAPLLGLPLIRNLPSGASLD